MLSLGFQLNGLKSIYFMSSFSFDQSVWNDQKQSSKVISDKTGKIIDDPIALTPFSFVPPQLHWQVFNVDAAVPVVLGAIAISATVEL